MQPTFAAVLADRFVDESDFAQTNFDGLLQKWNSFHSPGLNIFFRKISKPNKNVDKTYVAFFSQ